MSNYLEKHFPIHNLGVTKLWRLTFSMVLRKPCCKQVKAWLLRELLFWSWEIIQIYIIFFAQLSSIILKFVPSNCICVLVDWSVRNIVLMPKNKTFLEHWIYQIDLHGVSLLEQLHTYLIICLELFCHITIISFPTWHGFSYCLSIPSKAFSFCWIEFCSVCRQCLSIVSTIISVVYSK